MVWIFGVYAPNSTLCVSLMKIGGKKWAVTFRPETKKLRVRVDPYWKMKIFSKSHRRPQVLYIIMIPVKSWATSIPRGGGRGRKSITLLFDSELNASGPRLIRAFLTALERFCECTCTCTCTFLHRKERAMARRKSTSTYEIGSAVSPLQSIAVGLNIRKIPTLIPNSTRTKFFTAKWFGYLESTPQTLPCVWVWWKSEGKSGQ